MDQPQEQSLFDMQLDAEAQSSLLSVSKWTNFIAITGFIIGGLVLALAAAYGTQILQSFSELLSIGGNEEVAGVILVVIVIAIVLVAVWLYFLMKASRLIKRGLSSRNSAIMADGFRAMRVYFVISFVISLLSLLSTLTELF
jgi:uncharacterized membrane protein YdbT with pleckstrin-like domain